VEAVATVISRSGGSACGDLLAPASRSDFFIGILNQVAGADIPLAHLVLTLAINVCTLLQIAFLCDIHP